MTTPKLTVVETPPVINEAPPPSEQPTRAVRVPIVAKPIPKDMPLHILHEDNVWDAIRVGGFFGYVIGKDAPKKGTPTMMWEGGRIHLKLWESICAFFEWSQKEFRAETQVRLYYNPATRKWAAWAYPQKPNGMQTSEDGDHPQTAVQRAQFKDPWLLMGTVHHHCTMSAFQSGTDRSNEEAQTGLHITVGKVSTGQYDLHARVIIRNSQFIHYLTKTDGTVEINQLTQWFELPEAASNIKAALHKSILDYYLKCPPSDTAEFPETWKTNCIKPSWQNNNNHGGYYGGSHSSSTGGSSTGTGTSNGGSLNWRPIETNTRSQFKDNEVKFMEESLAYMQEKQLTHNEVDLWVNMTEESRLSDPQKNHVHQFVALATKNSVDEGRMDQMFDQWDFDITLKEIHAKAKTSVNTTQPIDTNAGIPA